MTGASQQLTVGVDIGGSKIEVALVDADGRVVATSRRPSGGMESDPDQVVAEVAARVAELRSDAPGEGIAALGIAVAGQIDPETGVVRYSPNLQWRDVPLRRELERALEIPAWAINDVQAVTWGEWRRGAGRGVSDLICLFVGTGVGGGIVAGGRLVTGASGSAGELGHTVLDPQGPLCHCGTTGCLEAYAGGWAIAQRVQRAVAEQPEAGRGLLALAHGGPETLSAAILAKAAHGSDLLARRLVDEVGTALGAGVASMVNALNPQLVILGGGVIEGLPELVVRVEETVRKRALPVSADTVRVVKSELGPHAGVVGAALWAGERLAAAG
jgi:glucokinase